MPPTKNYTAKPSFGQSFTSNEVSMSARVYHQATNLLPSSPPASPTGLAPSFGANSKTTHNGWSRQNSSSKYS